MTELAIREQIDAGLDTATDGRIRWHGSGRVCLSRRNGTREELS